LQRLSDCFGVVQHANFAIPDYRTGYTTDDNARALVVTAKYHRLHGGTVSRELAARYLAFLLFAQREDGRFHNLVAHDRRFLDEFGTEDCFGRAIWALAHLLCSPPQPGLVGPAERMLHRARGKAFCLTALYWWSRARPGDRQRARELSAPLAQYLVDRYREHSQPDWDWFLPELTYANAKLPEALFRAYQVTEEEELLAIARRTIEFLYERTIEENTLALVGNRGWYRYGQEAVPVYDQQPLDAAAMVQASLAAFDATGEVTYLRRAWVCLEWFYGRNLKSESLVDPETGGCFDGLTEQGVNLNRGAESTVSLLLAQLSVMESCQKLARDVLAGTSEEKVPADGTAGAELADG
jgi:hypothetical protein